VPTSPRLLPALFRVTFWLTTIAACAPAPPAIQPRLGPSLRRFAHVTPAALPLSAESVPSKGCTDLPLPAASANAAPIRATREQIHRLADVDRLLARHERDNDPAASALAQARALWNAGHWPEATRRLGEIATAHAQEDAGIVAAMLYLEGLNLLGSAVEPPRSSCYDEIVSRVPTFQKLYCEHGENRRHPHECHLLYRLSRDIERVGCGIPAEGPSPFNHAHGGARQLARAIRCVEATRLAGVSPLAEHCDDLAFDAMRHFMKVADEARADEARALLLDPGNGMRASPHVAELPTLAPRRP
jgi:hypothetical protein